MAETDVVLVDVDEGVALITLNRPEARNALSSELLRALPAAMAACDADSGVAAVVLTGADPVFCAGLDLKELGSTAGNIRVGSERRIDADATFSSPWPPMQKTLIGAINGAAGTGGLELALNCDFLIASDRARFGDPHTRVGILPGWGLTVLLPQAIGLRRAKEMSLTGNFLTADEALHFGLVNHVVAHDQLVTTATAIARDIASNDAAAVQALLASYKRIAATTVGDGLAIEAEVAREWQGRTFDPGEVERRRQGILERGRAQP